MSDEELLEAINWINYKRGVEMVFAVKSKKTGKEYYLHSKQVILRSGHKQILYFFSGNQKGALSNLPDGYEVFENERTGLPMLRKK